MTFTKRLISTLLLTPILLQAHSGHEHKEDAKATSEKAAIKQHEILGHGDYRYRVIADWGKLDKKIYPIKNAHAMVELDNGDLLTLCDDTRHNFLVYDKNGKLKKASITEYPGAHGIEHFMENGKERLIIVDSGWAVRNGKQLREQGRIVKTDINGQVIFSIGHPVTIGAYKPGWNFQPCDAAVADNGDIYVADGYGSQWVLHYDKNGRFLRKFGGPGKLNYCHGVSIDRRDPKKPRLMVSSRASNELHFYSMDGKFEEKVSLGGAYGGQAVQHGDHLYVGVCWSRNKKGTGKRISNSGFVLILDKNNKVVASLGGSKPEYKGGKLQPLHQTTKTFLHVHDLCVDKQGNIFVVQWNARGAYPIKLERVKP